MKALLIIVVALSSSIIFSQNQKDDYTKLKCGLYINKTGDIGFKTLYLIDDLGNHDTTYQKWIYGVDERDTIDGGLAEFKNTVDTSSFQILNDYYCKDKYCIYAIFYTSDGATFNATKMIDIKTFKPFGNSTYGMDKNSIYFRTQPITVAHRKTFKVIRDNPGAAFDQNNFYFYGEIMTPDEIKRAGYDQRIK